MPTGLFQARSQLNGTCGILRRQHVIHQGTPQGEGAGLVEHHAFDGSGLLNHITTPEQPTLSGGQP